MIVKYESGKKTMDVACVYEMRQMIGEEIPRVEKESCNMKKVLCLCNNWRERSD